MKCNYVVEHGENQLPRLKFLVSIVNKYCERKCEN